MFEGGGGEVGEGYFLRVRSAKGALLCPSSLSLRTIAMQAIVILRIFLFSTIQLVVYYHCCVLIG